MADLLGFLAALSIPFFLLWLNDQRQRSDGS